jgi:hypothetical protein
MLRTLLALALLLTLGACDSSEDTFAPPSPTTITYTASVLDGSVTQARVTYVDATGADVVVENADLPFSLTFVRTVREGDRARIELSGTTNKATVRVTAKAVAEGERDLDSESESQFSFTPADTFGIVAALSF